MDPVDPRLQGVLQEVFVMDQCSPEEAVDMAAAEVVGDTENQHRTDMDPRQRVEQIQVPAVLTFLLRVLADHTEDTWVC